MYQCRFYDQFPDSGKVALYKLSKEGALSFKTSFLLAESSRTWICFSDSSGESRSRFGISFLAHSFSALTMIASSVTPWLFANARSVGAEIPKTLLTWSSEIEKVFSDVFIANVLSDVSVLFWRLRRRCSDKKSLLQLLRHHPVSAYSYKTAEIASWFVAAWQNICQRRPSPDGERCLQQCRYTATRAWCCVLRRLKRKPPIRNRLTGQGRRAPLKSETPSSHGTLAETRTITTEPALLNCNGDFFIASEAYSI